MENAQVLELKAYILDPEKIENIDYIVSRVSRKASIFIFSS